MVEARFIISYYVKYTTRPTFFKSLWWIEVGVVFGHRLVYASPIEHRLFLHLNNHEFLNWLSWNWCLYLLIRWMRIIFNYFSSSINCLLSNRCWRTTWTRNILNTKFIALKLTKPIKDCVVGRCVAGATVALNEHNNPCVLSQFSNHRKLLCEIAQMRVENDVTVTWKK